MATQNLSQLRAYLESLLQLPPGDSYAGSINELQELNEAYQQTAYRFDWPGTLKRFADPITANVDRYSLQSDFRKFSFMRSLLDPKEETTIDQIISSRHKFAVDRISSEYILSEVPTTSSVTFTTSSAITVSSSLSVTVNSTSGISIQDEIFISDGTSSEFTKVQSTTSTTITAKFAKAHSSGVTFYRVAEMNDFQYQRAITLLSSETDVTVLPDELDFIIPHYAGYLFYTRWEQYDRAQKQLELWDVRTNEAWLSWSRNSAGQAGQFAIDRVT